MTPADQIQATYTKTTNARADYMRRLHCWTCGDFVAVDERGRQVWCDTCKESK